MYGIIDIGSNTIRLKVYKIEDDKCSSIIDKKEFAKLISYRLGDKLTLEGINECARVLNEYKKILTLVNVDKYYAFATASLRNISNTREVLDKIKELTGIDINVLSGEDEALYGYLGASSSIKSETGVVLDIGGGSLELTFFKHSEIESRKSIPTGSLNMQEAFLSKHKVIDFKTKKMEKYINKLLDNEDITEGRENIYGVGGSIRALLKIKNKETGLVQTGFTYEDVKRWYQMLKEKPDEWLRLVLNVVPERTLTVSTGLIIVKTVMSYLEAKNVFVCEGGVREGYLTHVLNEV